jgi:hypothetical protein
MVPAGQGFVFFSLTPSGSRRTGVSDAGKLGFLPAPKIALLLFLSANLDTDLNYDIKEYLPSLRECGKLWNPHGVTFHK